MYRARSRDPAATTHPLVVSAWTLDKRTASKEQLAACRAEMATLARLKHPSLLRLIAPLEETRTQLVVLTEIVTSSLADVLKGPERLEELEVKLGLLNIAEALQFLHNNAGLVHAGVCPASIFVSAQEGVWKLGGFAFAAHLDYKVAGQHAFDYRTPGVLAPPLPYSAPELVLATGDVTATADIFSLGLLTYELLTAQQLLQVYDVAGYQSRINSFGIVDLSGLPLALQAPMRVMLSPAPEGRPPAASFVASNFFAGDASLRALRFLRSMASKEPVQKSAFLADLPRIAAGFNPRVLKQVVLPALVGELRMRETQTAAVTFLVDRVLPHQSGDEFVGTFGVDGRVL